MKEGTIRGAAAYVVGAFLAAWAQYGGFILDEDSATALVQAVSVLFGTAYYMAVRVLAMWQPWLELLLIIPKAPVYVRPDQKSIQLAKRNTDMIR